MTDAEEIAILKDHIEILCTENKRLKNLLDKLISCQNCLYKKDRYYCTCPMTCKNHNQWEIAE